MARRKSGGMTVPSLAKVEGSRILFPEGEYRAKIAGVEPAEKKRGSAGGLWWTFEITEGKFEGKTTRMFTSFEEAALWNIKSLLDTIAYEIPDDDFDIDADDVIDRELVILIGHGEYNGRPQARVESFGPVDDDEKPKKKGKAKSKSDDDEDDEDEKPAKKSRGKSKAKDEDDEDEDEDEKPKRGAKSKKKPADDDDDEDEDEKPAKKGKKSKPKKLSSDDINEMDQDELQAFVDENELEIDLDDYKSLRKMRAAVIETADELLED